MDKCTFVSTVVRAPARESTPFMISMKNTTNPSVFQAKAAFDVYYTNSLYTIAHSSADVTTEVLQG
jgi:hypothetical protein